MDAVGRRPVSSCPSLWLSGRNCLIDFGNPLMASPELTPHGFGDLALGQTARLRHVVTDADVADFARLTGDANPIHLDEAYAATTRFGGRIAHGMFTAGLISALLGTKLPGPGAIYISQTLRFLAPVRIGAELEASVEVVALEPRGRRCRMACRVVAGDIAVLDGEAEVMVPAKAVALPSA
jgi:3-hydroxybutyryl-CoA dehydratase